MQRAATAPEAPSCARAGRDCRAVEALARKPERHAGESARRGEARGGEGGRRPRSHPAEGDANEPRRPTAGGDPPSLPGPGKQTAAAGGRGGTRKWARGASPHRSTPLRPPREAPQTPGGERGRPRGRLRDPWRKRGRGGLPQLTSKTLAPVSVARDGGRAQQPEKPSGRGEKKVPRRAPSHFTRPPTSALAATRHPANCSPFDRSSLALPRTSLAASGDGAPSLAGGFA